MACIELQEKSPNPIAPPALREVTVVTKGALRAAARAARYPAFAAGQAASSARSAATKASGWSIITWCSASGITT